MHVRFAVKMAMNVPFRCIRFPADRYSMMLIGVQNLLYAFQFILGDVLLRRQTAGIVQLFFRRFLRRRFHRTRADIRRMTRTGRQTLSTLLQTRRFLDPSRRLEGKISGEVQISWTARNVASVSRKRRALMLQNLDASRLLQAQLLRLLMRHRIVQSS